VKQTTIDDQTFTIAFERNLSASPDEVFDAWTRPDQISEWWDPTGIASSSAPSICGPAARAAS
jgi:uncharacterized protein YndB with AHSA1/START domain